MGSAPGRPKRQQKASRDLHQTETQSHRSCLSVSRDDSKPSQFAELGNVARNGYMATALIMLIYAGCVVVFTVLFLPDIQWFSYFVVDYDTGFVRRGLAGEILNLFPDSLYFVGLFILRWLVPVVFIASLVALATTVACRFGCSERRLMLALLIPLLPFGFVRAVVMPTPELLGGAALVLFALALAAATTDQAIVFSGAAYGVANAVLTLVHEAGPLLYSVGAIMAIVILAVKSRIPAQRLCAFVAITPGLLIAIMIGLFGHADMPSQCAQLPHRAVYNPIKLSLGQILSGERAYSDFHDWVCRLISVQFSTSPTDSLRGLIRLGMYPWIMSTVAGLVIFGGTILAIRLVSGVPVRGFCKILLNRRVWVIAAAGFLLPLFATSTDWVRWWVNVSFAVGVVYLIYAASKPESTNPPTPRGRVFFAVGMVLLALFPSGTVPHIGVLEQVQFYFEE